MAAVLEVACGTGQIARRLARMKRDVTGMDLSPRMLAFLREQASIDGISIRTVCADMTTFASDRSYAAAFNPMSSFRLLQTDAQAQAHLRAMAAALRIVLRWGVEGHLRNYTASAFVDRIAAMPSWRIESWYPEVARIGEESISTFDADDPKQSPSPGRVMVLLRRI